MHKITSILLVAVLTVLLGNIQGNAQGSKMKYLVQGEYVEPGPLMPQEQVMKMIEGVVIPSLDMLARWEEEGKITGGLAVGARRGVFVMEASSHEEVDKMLQSLPFWGLLKWEVTALHSFKGRANQEREAVKAMSTKKQ